MDWEFKVRVDVCKVDLNADRESKTKFANVDIVKHMPKEMAEAFFGKPFADGLFRAPSADEQTEDDAPLLWKGNQQPTEVLSSHRVTLTPGEQGGDDEVRAKCQPVIRKISPVKDEPKVEVIVRLPIEYRDRNASGKLGMLIGETIDVRFEPVQISLVKTGASEVEGEEADSSEDTQGEMKIVRRGPHGRPVLSGGNEPAA